MTVNITETTPNFFPRDITKIKKFMKFYGKSAWSIFTRSRRNGSFLFLLGFVLLAEVEFEHRSARARAWLGVNWLVDGFVDHLHKNESTFENDISVLFWINWNLIRAIKTNFTSYFPFAQRVFFSKRIQRGRRSYLLFICLLRSTSCHDRHQDLTILASQGKTTLTLFGTLTSEL